DHLLPRKQEGLDSRACLEKIGQKRAQFAPVLVSKRHELVEAGRSVGEGEVARDSLQESGCDCAAGGENLIFDCDTDCGRAFSGTEDTVRKIFDREIGHSHPSRVRSSTGSSKEHDPKLMAKFARASRICAAVSL